MVSTFLPFSLSTNHLLPFFHCISTEIPAVINLRSAAFRTCAVYIVKATTTTTHCQKFHRPYACIHVPIRKREKKPPHYVCVFCVCEYVYACVHVCVCIPSPLDGLLCLVCMVNVPTTAPMFAAVVVETSASVC